jgi:hypothetical protein
MPWSSQEGQITPLHVQDGIGDPVLSQDEEVGVKHQYEPRADPFQRTIERESVKITRRARVMIDGLGLTPPEDFEIPI